MSEAQNSPPQHRWRVVVLSLVLFPAVYFGVMAALRAYVDHQVERNQGETLGSFQLEDRAGNSWSEQQLAGKVAVIHFFRSFCSNCSAEAAAIRRLEQSLDPDRVVLLGVMTDRLEGFDAASTAATLEKYAFRHPVLMADAGFADSFHGTEWAHVTPITYVADANGVVRGTLRGAQTFASFVDAIRAAGGQVDTGKGWQPVPAGRSR